MRRTIALSLSVLAIGCAQVPVATIPAAPAGQAQAVVFDIDGTLTPNVLAIHEVRPDAAAAVRAFSDKGYKIFYVSTRAWLFRGSLPGWLRDNGFPQEPIYLPQTSEELRQTDDEFKTRVLQGLIDRGWKLSYAYGDSTTDFIAYGAAGIPKQQVYALRRVGDADCQPGYAPSKCLGGWTEHLEFIKAVKPASAN